MNQTVDNTVNEGVDPKRPEEHCTAVVFENKTAQQTPNGCTFLNSETINILRYQTDKSRKKKYQFLRKCLRKFPEE